MSLKKKTIDYYFEPRKKKKFENDEKQENDRSASMPKSICEKASISFISHTKNNLKLRYAVIFSKQASDCIYNMLEEKILYEPQSYVKIFGKTIDVPRKRKAYGDPGLSYSFSGITVYSEEWIPFLEDLKLIVERTCQYEFNFVLVNRYKNGNDYIGYHQDAERDLNKDAPIASLSFGQQRDFSFAHKDSRGKKKTSSIPNFKLSLEHGSLLIMDPPTNNFWYHSLPKRSVAACANPRINLTFRKMRITNN